VDIKNPHGNHVIYDGMNHPPKRIQMVKSNDPMSQYRRGYDILELWYVKVASSADAPGSAPSAVPPKVQPRVPLPLVSSASATLPTTSAISSSAIMPPGIQNLGNTCYLTTLMQITFWVAPLANGWIDAKLTKKESSKLFDQSIFCWQIKDPYETV
jgi:ubiquitin C-terminal hydrolase